MNETLEKVKQYADEAHGSQMRKYTPQRYIVHPIEVMEICSEYTNDLCILAAALCTMCWKILPLPVPILKHSCTPL